MFFNENERNKHVQESNIKRKNERHFLIILMKKFIYKKMIENSIILRREKDGFIFNFSCFL